MMVAEEQRRAPHSTSRLLERRSFRYLCWYLLLPAIAYLFPFYGERFRPFRAITQSIYGPVMDYSYGQRNVNADIILFGDSSALFGIDTLKLSRDLHLKVINIPGTQPGLTVTVDTALRRYLTYNRPPRLIVFYFTAWDLDYETIQTNITYQGYEAMIRNGTPSELITLFRKHPREVLGFPFEFYGIPSRVTRFYNEALNPQFVLIQGHVPSPDKDTLKIDCDMPEVLRRENNGRTVHELVLRFTTRNSQSLVYITPVPSCTSVSELTNRVYANVGAEPPAVLPSKFFINDLSYAHPLAAHTDLWTDLLARSIRKKLDMAKSESELR